MIQDVQCDAARIDSPPAPAYQERPISPYSTEPRSHGCSECGDAFAHGHQLTEHVRQVHGNARAHVCGECGKGFATTSGLKQHQHIHSSVKPFQCEVCLKSYTQFSNLCRHKRMHADCRQQIKCHECGQAFSTLHSLNKHKRFCEGVMRGSTGMHRHHIPGGAGPGLPPLPLSAPAPTMNPGPLPSAAPAGLPHPAAALHAYMASLYKPGFPIPPGPFSFASGLPSTGVPGGLPGGLDFAKLMQESMVRRMELYKSSLLLQQHHQEKGEKRSFSEMDASASEYEESGSDDGIHIQKKSLVVEKEEEDVNDWDSGLDSAPLEDRKSGSGSGRDEPEREPSPLRAADIQHTSTPINSSCCGEQVTVTPTPQVIRPLSFSSPQPHLTSSFSSTQPRVSAKMEDPRPKPNSVCSSSVTPATKPSGGESTSSPTGAEAPLDLTVRSRVPSPQQSPKRTHIFGDSTGKEPASRSPSPKPTSDPRRSPVSEKSMIDDRVSASSPPALRFPVYKPEARDLPTYKPPTIEDLKDRIPPPSSSGYPMPNPYLLSRMFGVPEEKLGFPHMVPGYPSLASYPPRPAPAAFPGMPPMSPEKLGAFPAMPSPYGMKMGVAPGYGYQAAFNGGKNKYACKFCGKIFPRSANLTRHLRTHTGEQPYKCKYCERSFSISSNLQRHIRNIHNKEKPYRCQICDRSFGQQTNLDRHLKKHEYGTLDTSLDDSVEEADRSLPAHPAHTPKAFSDINGNESGLKEDEEDGWVDPVEEDEEDEEDLDPGSDDLEVSAVTSPGGAAGGTGSSPVNEYRGIDSSFSINALIGAGGDSAAGHKSLLPHRAMDAN